MSRRPDSLPAPAERRILASTVKESAPSTPRLALSRQEAAEAIGISLDSFERHVQPHLRCNYIGSRRIYLIDDITAWLAQNAVEANGGSV